jgi:hypothetical protein
MRKKWALAYDYATQSIDPEGRIPGKVAAARTLGCKPYFD